LDINFLGRVLEHVFKGIYILVLVDVSFGNFVEEESYGSFPERKKVNEVGDDDSFQAGFWKYLFHVAEIGIQADNGLCPRVIDHIFNFKGGVNGRNGNNDRSNFLNSKKSDDPLHRIRNINHHLVPFADPELGQGGSKSVNEILQSRIREAFTQINNGRTIRIFFTHPFESGEG
jgi:hypothetical protein